ncbi:MAG TPA: helix-turn-helix domain-containing protein [Solirubrobacteraceae bacterium]
MAQRTRRSTEEVRALVVDAASALFDERGYTQTTMRDVAAEAGIGVSVLYRHFSNKERLFAATFVAPFLASFEQFRADRVDGADDERRVGEFVRDLHHNLAANRHAILTLLTVLEDPATDLIDEVRAGLGDAWRNLQLAASGSADDSVPAHERERDANMLVVALVVGLALFQPWVEAARDGDDQPLVDLAPAFVSAGIRAAVATRGRQ